MTNKDPINFFNNQGKSKPEDDLRIRIFMNKKTRKPYMQLSVRSRVKRDSLAQQEIYFDDTTDQILKTVEMVAGACAEHQNRVLGDDHTPEYIAWVARDAALELVHHVQHNKVNMKEHVDTVIRYNWFHKPVAEIGKMIYTS